jgi:hypothetical protein
MVTERELVSMPRATAYLLSPVVVKMLQKS